MKNGIIKRKLNKVIDGLQSEIDKEFKSFSNMNNLDDIMSAEDKNSVKRLFTAMKKNGYASCAYANVGDFSAGLGMIIGAVSLTYNALYNNMLIYPGADIDVINGVSGVAVAGLIALGAYNGIKSYFYKQNSNNKKGEIDEILVDAEKKYYAENGTPENNMGNSGCRIVPFEPVISDENDGLDMD